MGDRHSPACPTSWSDGVFEFISSADTVSHEVCCMHTGRLVVVRGWGNIALVGTAGSEL